MGIGLTIIIGVAIILLLIIIIAYIIGIYNGFITLKNNIDKSWGNIDVLLKQRSDELPNLIATVKGFMRHEKELLTQLTEARTKYMEAKTTQEKANADNAISGTLKTLFAVSENYPTLKSDQTFIRLQKRISDLENQLADRREFYNDSVNNYNIKLESFPDKIIGNSMNLQKKEMFKVEESEKKNVKVEF